MALLFCRANSAECPATHVFSRPSNTPDSVSRVMVSVLPSLASLMTGTHSIAENLACANGKAPTMRVHHIYATVSIT